MAKITKTFVDKVQPPASGYAVHWDDSVKGYGLRVSSQGKRVFIAMGRVLGDTASPSSDVASASCLRARGAVASQDALKAIR